MFLSDEEDSNKFTQMSRQQIVRGETNQHR
jgi:hypothetical protein